MRHRFLATCLSITAILGLALWGMAQVERDRAPEAWKPDEASLDKLGPEASLREYAVRPPKGYAVALRQQKEGFQLVVWRGEARPDRTAPALMVTLTTIPPGEKLTTPENYLVADLAQVRKRRPSLSPSDSSSRTRSRLMLPGGPISPGRARPPRRAPPLLCLP